jgi:hypothetical protein
MMYTTLNKIESCTPYESGLRKLLKHLGKTKADDGLPPFVDSKSLADALWCCSASPEHDREWRLFAIRCARQVQHLMEDSRSIDAIDVAERFANGLATQSELITAETAAWAAWTAAGTAAETAAGTAAWAAWTAAETAAGTAAETAAWAAWTAARTAARIVEIAAWAAETAAWAVWTAAGTAAETAAGTAARIAAGTAARAAAWIAAGTAARIAETTAWAAWTAETDAETAAWAAWTAETDAETAARIAETAAWARENRPEYFSDSDDGESFKVKP